MVLLYNNIKQQIKKTRSLSSLSFLCLFLGLGLLSACSSHKQNLSHASNHAYQQEQKPSAVKESVQQQFAQELNSWKGVTYKYGGMTKRGVDCSGFVKCVYDKIFNLNLNHNSRMQYDNDCDRIIKKQRNLKIGDLVFFVTSGKKTQKSNINHVGIYIGKGLFMHASTKHGVIISKLADSYYQKNYVSAGRIKAVNKKLN